MCLVILVEFKSAENLSQKQTFKCSPNPKSCQAHPDGAFHVIPGGVGSAFSAIVSFAGMGWGRTSGMAPQPPAPGELGFHWEESVQSHHLRDGAASCPHQ